MVRRRLLGVHRGLRERARDGFAHFVIVGSVAPRKVIYAHEFAWDAKTDPAWPRLQKIFDFYEGRSAPWAHGSGKFRVRRGRRTRTARTSGPCIAMIYPALKDWFEREALEEYSKPPPGRRPAVLDRRRRSRS